MLAFVKVTGVVIDGLCFGITGSTGISLPLQIDKGVLSQLGFWIFSVVIILNVFTNVMKDSQRSLKEPKYCIRFLRLIPKF